MTDDAADRDGGRSADAERDEGGSVLRGASARTVREVIANGDPLPGTRGFAGGLPDGRLVRDVLGRQPCFTERGDPGRWSFDPTTLEDPVSVSAGSVRAADGDRTVWTLPDPEPTEDREAAVAAVREAVLASVREVDPAGLAVAFSGGLDSGLVAAGVPDAPCYVGGFPEANDVEAARKAADLLDRELRVVEFSHADLERAVPAVVAATGRTNAMDVQIAVSLYLVAERAAADGVERLAVGQGADELFGGYAKVAEAPDDPRTAADTVRGARREIVLSLPAQLERDVLALRAAGVEPVAPLLHDRVVRAALPLSGALLAADGQRKIALRRAAADALPDPIVAADKKAVQYGSLVARELDRLARQAGFKRRMDDHVGQYIESIVAE